MFLDALPRKFDFNPVKNACIGRIEPFLYFSERRET